MRLVEFTAPGKRGPNVIPVEYMRWSRTGKVGTSRALKRTSGRLPIDLSTRPFTSGLGPRPQLSRVPALGAEITPGTPSVPAAGTESARELRELASSPIVIGLGIGETLFVNTVGPTLWPFSRLVHGWSLPLQYRGRPYILCRRRLAALPRR
jgi:hypothetical protein